MRRGFGAVYALIGILALVVAGVTYYIMLWNNFTPHVDRFPSSSIPSPSPTPQADFRVSYANVKGEIYLKYNGKIYKKDELNQDNRQYGEPAVVELKNQSSLDWKLLLNPSVNVSTSPNDPNELFSFQIFPDKYKFLFVMRWLQTPSTRYGEAFQIFHFEGDKISDPISLDDPKYNSVPKIYQISPDGEYVSFNMYRCWNCGGDHPETLLLRLTDVKIKRIGKTTYFSWKNGGAYEYKDFIIEPCPPDSGPGTCYEKPDTLPIKTGQF